jgi:phosphopantothenoylcysteine decarboxylase/phosphopantothenate--cysteine ligase
VYLGAMKIVITSGGTREKIDPVRYIGNYSSGKMGKALAEAFAKVGEVLVISGPAEVHYGQPMQRVESAQEMLQACEAALPCDVFIAAAAVADMRPKNFSSEKIKKHNLSSIELIENPDILSIVGHLPPSNSPRKREEDGSEISPPLAGGSKGELVRPRLVIGFAAESEQHLENARIKLTKKSCDLIILNDTSAMGEDENEVFIVSQHEVKKLERASKDEIAQQIVKYLEEKSWFQLT